MLLTHSETVQLRVEMFNPRNAAIITVSNTTMNLSNPTDSATITNLPFDSNLGLTAESRQQTRVVFTRHCQSTRRPCAKA